VNGAEKPMNRIRWEAVMLKKLFYASASILMLAIAYHLGANTATAQSGTQVSGFSASSGSEVFWVLTPNGDVFQRIMNPGQPMGTLLYLGNFWSGSGPTGLAPIP
jgi:hypothetical protein